MGVILDDLWDYEGYSARRLADGTHTGAWSLASASFEAYVASCGSGWAGRGRLPPRTAMSRPWRSGRTTTPARCWLAPSPTTSARSSATLSSRVAPRLVQSGTRRDTWHIYFYGTYRASHPRASGPFIPAAMRRQLGLEPGSVVLVRLEGDALRLERQEAALDRLRARYAKATGGPSVVDELVSERREGARREAEG